MTLLALFVASPAHAATLAVCETCDYTSVGAALAAASDGDEITVAAGTWEVGATVTLTLSIVGEGAGSTILTRSDGLNNALQVTSGGALSLSNMTLTGAGDGRAMLVDGSSASLWDVTIEGGGGGSGAGIYVQDDSSLFLDGCTLSDNNAGSDGVGGHIVVVDSSISVYDSRFSVGSAGSGGAIWADDSTLAIEDSAFESNSVSPASGSGYGGALRVDGGDLVLGGGSFTDNAVTGSGGGGAISVANATAELSDLSITGGQAESGAGIYLNDATASLVDVRVSDSVAQADDTARGGAVAAFGGQTLIDGGTFVGNSVQGGDFAAGGAIYANDSRLQLTDGLVQDNLVSGDSSVYGGGVYVSGADLAIDGSTLQNNRAEGDGSGVLGGGLFARVEHGTVDIADSTLSGNSADYGGGGAFFTDTSDGRLLSVNLTDSDLSDNTALIGGGLSIYTAAEVTVSMSTVQGNSGTDAGGGIFWRPGEEGAPAGSLSITDSRMVENLGGNGGGLYALYGDALSLVGADLVANQADDGGGAWIYGVAWLDVSLSVFCGNVATVDDGGGASLSYSGDSEWSNVVLADNSAADNGGGLQVYEPDGTLTVVNDSFLGNSAADNGGGLYIYGSSDASVVNTLFAWTVSGDGLYSSEVIDASALRYNAWVANSEADLGGVLTDVGDGNVSLKDPGLWAYSPGGDCDSFVFAHRPDSDLVDAGDPSILDSDDSASDIGAYGGPDADPDWLLDGDGDGFPGAVDCDDGDASVNPDATEIPYNGVDDDCDGADLCDVDEDGFDSELCDGEDCDDEDAAINPWADDPDENGIDEDCDGGDGPGGSTDGGSTDGGSTDGGSTDGGGTDGGATDGGATDGGSSDGGSIDGGSIDGEGTDGGSTDSGTDGGKDGCGCTAGTLPPGMTLWLLPLLALRRRR